MRYSWLIGAVCAAGAMAKPIDKRAYVIDWTIVTVTETITLSPGPEPTPAPAYSPIQAVQLTHTVVSDVPAPVEAEPKPADSVPTPVAPVGKVEELPGASAWSTAWTSTWTSAWTSPVPEAAQPTTLTTSTPSPAPAPPAPAPPAANAYQSAVLYNHNIHRSNHSASSMIWNSTLESSAYDLASQCVYQHNT
jgi:hypothetical protein